MAKVSVDFSGVSDGGGGQYDVSAGKHTAKVLGIEQKPPGQSGYPYLQWDLEIVGGTDAGKKITHRTSLKPSALFNLRNTLLACGLKVPKSALSFEPDKLAGKTLGINVIITEDGYSNIKDTFVPGQDDDGEEEIELD